MNDAKQLERPPEILAHEHYVTLQEAAKMLGLSERYAGESIRNGYLKGKIGYKSASGRYHRYNYNDLLRVVEQATVPARRL
jgi:YD repeat-containing protein